ncbi:glycosyl-transferase for dystroglycan domain-containing protein [Phthorimaea operculella]|nr:glycosyl-transferase for dystroglycan domain-containing protein [Phthorimaea operculella]
MRCWRVCGAYSFRLTRRHSTFLLIATLFVCLTIILQFYHRKHQEYVFKHYPTGDFLYKPGAFLQGQQPNENVSYCQFNYGLPETLNWSAVTPYPSPEMGTHGPHKIIYNAIKSTAYDNVSKYDTVTYATQATPEFLYHIVEIARYWDGPISLSVFVPNYDLDITMQIMDHLCHCYPGMAKVSLHLFYNIHIPPKMSRDPPVVPTLPTENETTITETEEEALNRKRENYRNLTNETRAKYIEDSIKKKIKRMTAPVIPKRTRAPYLNFKDCSGLDSYDIPTYRRLYDLLYPINVGRNSARNASHTNYFIVSDIEMVPSDRLASKFSKMLRELIGSRKRDAGFVIPNTVFVVPLFEVEVGERIPREKAELVALVEDNRAMYFHQKACSHCQRFPGLQTWLKRPPTDEVQMLFMTKREYPFHRWEPIYFGTAREPWFNEFMYWEGLQEKMLQVLEVCLRRYRFAILDGGFLCHAGGNLPSNSQLAPPMLIAKREYPYHRWEPLYFGTNRDPWYNEILSWEGVQEKMAQVFVT